MCAERMMGKPVMSIRRHEVVGRLRLRPLGDRRSERCAIRCAPHSSGHLPISEGRFLSLLFERSRVTRLVKQAISDGRRVNWLSFKYKIVNCDNDHNVGDRLRTLPVISISFPGQTRAREGDGSETRETLSSRLTIGFLSCGVVLRVACEWQRALAGLRLRLAGVQRRVRQRRLRLIRVEL